MAGPDSGGVTPRKGLSPFQAAAQAIRLEMKEVNHAGLFMDADVMARAALTAAIEALPDMRACDLTVGWDGFGTGEGEEATTAEVVRRSLRRALLGET